MLSIESCNLCPRACGIDRNRQTGFCECGNKIKIARAALHFWEEPCISGKNGSGTVFFSGCTLRCCYCQNYRISHEAFGREVSRERLTEIFLELEDKGAHNINLVTATQYLPWVIEALDRVKGRLKIPVVYNCGGYERVETIRALKGYVDVFLPDLKYFGSGRAAEYSGAGDYFETASVAIKEMAVQTGCPVYDGEGLLRKGVVIRHMVLPGGREDSIAILNWLAANFQKGSFLLSLMRQYTPCYKSAEHREINRRLTTLEYEAVVREALRLKLTDGFIQEKGSADQAYTPPFDMEGV
jgi:putative pyruvate formate lyase activating enzyme